MNSRYTASRLRANLYRVLDRVLETGEPVEIERKGRLLRIEAVPPTDRLSRLRPHPEAIRADPETLVHLDWSAEWQP
jgi:antitoxin (DNA-binding transcriptional repressor) of toxin-antitoxin stability system